MQSFEIYSSNAAYQQTMPFVIRKSATREPCGSADIIPSQDSYIVRFIGDKLFFEE